jgi:hypothetical protein
MEIHDTQERKRCVRVCVKKSLMQLGRCNAPDLGQTQEKNNAGGGFIEVCLGVHKQMVR